MVVHAGGRWVEELFTFLLRVELAFGVASFLVISPGLIDRDVLVALAEQFSVLVFETFEL